ncbi:hypothetical protein M011DRAFT_238095 [Sporormia fimetaria CBS 119925]|uniref:Uncharacterized protein n=1 Tax=Sporormia fimetaria CBS 119925 TaxID=1340428 RepID=A0A6A6VIB1_9PLEO|nr:hypothetical protein M011DRAFT_238095 [Sporormia fimetaria CBS 119925]
MSQPGPAGGKAERRKSLGNYVKRMSSVFKREKPAKLAKKEPSSSSPAPASTAATPSASTEPKKEQPATTEAATATATAAPTTTTAPPLASSTAAAAPTTTTTAADTASANAPKDPKDSTTTTHRVNHAAVQQERAIALFAKYGLTLEAHEWIAHTSHPVTVQRVERPIRMRMHRFCHHCGSEFGIEKVCPQCEHPRCKKCPRHTLWTSPANKAKQVDARDEPKKKKRMLLMHTSQGEERAYQPPRQRVRRTCHRCQAFFVPATATNCAQCNHVRCIKCPRDPPKLSKWPNGYPGDAPATDESETEVERPVPVQVRRTWRKPRQRVRWECHKCHSAFNERAPHCPGCGHERCGSCTRTPVKKEKESPQFDPEVLRAVEEKLHALAVDDPPAHVPQPT